MNFEKLGRWESQKINNEFSGKLDPEVNALKQKFTGIKTKFLRKNDLELHLPKIQSHIHKEVELELELKIRERFF